MRNLFPNAWYVARREYAQRVHTRTFVIVTIVLAVVGLGLTLMPVAIRLIVGENEVDVGLLAAPDTVDVGQLDSLLNADPESDVTYRIVSVTDTDAGQASVQAGDLDGMLSVTRAANDDLAFDYYSDATSTSQPVAAIYAAAAALTRNDRLLRAGVDPAEIGAIAAPIAFDLTPTTPSSDTGRLFEGAAGGIAYVLVILTFMAVITYGTWVATSVAEEKSSRVMELLVTAATPRQLLGGKILGAGGAGLTQYLAVLAAVVVGLLVQAILASRLFGSGDIDLLQGADLTVLIPFTIFFVPGFLLYCTLYAGLGSIASRQEDVNQVTSPMLFIGLGGYLVSFIALSVPDAAWVTLLSLIPFFSPYLLPARYVLTGNIAPWEWVVAGVLMALFLAGALWFAARIYSAGVLLYGQRSNLRSVWNAVRVSR